MYLLRAGLQVCGCTLCPSGLCNVIRTEDHRTTDWMAGEDPVWFKRMNKITLQFNHPRIQSFFH